MASQERIINELAKKSLTIMARLNWGISDRHAPEYYEHYLRAINRAYTLLSVTEDDSYREDFKLYRALAGRNYIKFKTESTEGYMDGWEYIAYIISEVEENA